jgi:predicted nucleotide-binding protein
MTHDLDPEMLERDASPLDTTQSILEFSIMLTREQNLIAALAKPTIFIGSSSEGIKVANKLAKGLARIADCRKWNQGVFGVGQGRLEALVKATREHDFAILVLTPDDVQAKRGKKMSIPRDNVIFELGLFMGALGKDRTFIVISSDKPITLPSDLDGITQAEFDGANFKEVRTKLQRAMQRAPARVLDLTGQWYSSYQRHDPPIGEWVEDMTEVLLKPPAKLSFRNYHDRVGSEYEAIGEFRGDGEIVGVWRERLAGARATGSFHLHVDPFGHKLYGICTGPSSRGENIYSGWVLVRDDAGKLINARRELSKAMLVCRAVRIRR